MTTEFTSFHGARYRLLRKLGEGGKGIVFLCQDTVLNRNVAVKVIKEEGSRGPTSLPARGSGQR